MGKPMDWPPFWSVVAGQGVLGIFIRLNLNKDYDEREIFPRRWLEKGEQAF